MKACICPECQADALRAEGWGLPEDGVVQCLLYSILWLVLDGGKAPEQQRQLLCSEARRMCLCLEGYGLQNVGCWSVSEASTGVHDICQLMWPAVYQLVVGKGKEVLNKSRGFDLCLFLWRSKAGHAA